MLTTTIRRMKNEFVLVSFSALSSEIQALLFLLFLIIYLVTLTGNVLIILVTTADSELVLLEIGFNLVIVPKVLGTLITQDTAISFLGCAAQMYFFFFFGAAECCLLATMAYDRYVAICDPLRYPVIMGRRACAQLAAASWVSGFPVATVQTTWIFSFPFCGPNRVNHFFCDSPPVIALVCADTSVFELEALTATVLFILFPFLWILGSYVRILSAVFRMPAAEGKHRAFSTCSSHLLVVSLFYSTAILTYFRPRSSTSPEGKKLLSLSYTVLTPMLNPIIYSLRNSEVKAALRRVVLRALGPRKL
uniref:Olfactory receptor n=1 Tax=Sus scrofa TaxID=9823 RepID=A0A5G2QKP4_PIG